MAAVETRDRYTLFLTMTALGVSSVLNAIYFLRTVIRIYSVGRGGADISAPQIYAQAHNDPGGDQMPPDAAASRLAYRIPAAVLTLANLFLGLFSWITMDLIQRGLAMFG